MKWNAFSPHGDRLSDSYTVPSLDLVVVRQGHASPPDRAKVRSELLQKIVAALPKHEARPGNKLNPRVAEKQDST